MNPSNHWKLGLFVLGGTALAFALLIWIGAANFDRETIPAFTYFDESVQGLDVGSSVKFRGVTIGEVTDIDIAQDRRLVEVRFDMFAEDMRELGFGDLDEMREEWGSGTFVPDTVRVSIASAGITGLKFLEVDIYDPQRVKAPPELDFAPLWNYVPSTPSTIKGIEESIRQTADSIPRLIEDIRALAESTAVLVDNPDVSGLLAASRTFVDTANEQLGGAGLPALGDELRTMAASVRDDVSALRARLDDVLASIDGLASEGGPVTDTLARADALLAALETELADARIGATTSTLRGTADEARGLIADSRAVVVDVARLDDDTRVTLATLRETLDAVRDLVQLLERNPSALLSGKSNP